MNKTNLPSSARLEIFSDSVFAIIMTLLILEIRVPEVKDGTGSIVFSTLKPLILAFAFILRPLSLLLLFFLPLIFVVPAFFKVAGKDH